MENKKITNEAQEALEKIEQFEGEVIQEKSKTEINPTETKKQEAAILKELKKREGIIKKQVGNIQKAFLTIGFQLAWIKNTGAHKKAGYKNIYDYAENEHGIGRTNTCNFICIIENFAERDKDGNIIENIQECYRNFTASQLVAMIGMDENTRKLVTADMSVRKINEIRKNAEKTGEPEEEPEENPEDLPKKVAKAEIVAEFTAYNDWLSNIEKIEHALEKAFKAGKKVKIVTV